MYIRECGLVRRGSFGRAGKRGFNGGVSGVETRSGAAAAFASPHRAR